MRPIFPGLCLLIGLATAPVAAFGVAQLVTTATGQLSGVAATTDFLNLYSGAFLFVSQPASTYDAASQAAVQAELQGGGSAYLPFLLAPHGALLLAPLAFLPYGMAYLVWLVLGIVGLILSAYLLAPRVRYAWSWLLWLPLLLLYLPAQQALIMGQTSVLALLGWSVFVRGLQRPRVLALLPWSLKPQLLPLFLVALALDRRRRDLIVVLSVIGVLTAAALVHLGPEATVSYVHLSAAKFQSTGAGASTDYNVTILAAADWLVGSGPLSTVATVVIVGALWLLFVGVWRRGLAADDRWLLQVALLPLVAVVTAPYALSYELTSWLASLWLVMQYCIRVQHNRSRASACLLAVWLSANLAVIFPHAGARLATLSGVALTILVVWLYRTATASRHRVCNHEASVH